MEDEVQVDLMWHEWALAEARQIQPSFSCSVELTNRGELRTSITTFPEGTRAALSDTKEGGGE